MSRRVLAAVIAGLALAGVGLHGGVRAQSVAAHPLAADDPQIRIGAAIYTDTCMACHTGSGKGVPGLFPKLAGSETVQQDDPSYLVITVLQGAAAGSSAATPNGPAMPSLGWRLSNDQVAAVLTYVRNSWGNAAPKVTAAVVGDLRSKL